MTPPNGYPPRRHAGLSADAHVAAVADATICPILTLNAAKWRAHTAALDEPPHAIEIADPGEAPGSAEPEQ
jgi:hypothetical protein